MKQLLLVRHAKSSWDNIDLDDLDRPLNKRGKKEATLLGRLLKKNGLIPQLIISSPAKRAYKTAIKMTHELNLPKKNIEENKIIYSGNTPKIIELISSLDKKTDLVLIVGHYPSIMELGNYLTGSNFLKLKTSGFILINLKIKSWKEIAKDKGNILLIDRAS